MRSKWLDADETTFSCPDCGEPVCIGGKMAVFWTCPSCHEYVKVPDDDSEGIQMTEGHDPYNHVGRLMQRPEPEPMSQEQYQRMLAMQQGMQNVGMQAALNQQNAYGSRTSSLNDLLSGAFSAQHWGQR